MFIIAADTDTGIKKSINQDSVFIKRARFQNYDIVFSVICDGMGGLDKGELASRSVLEAFNRWFVENFPPLLAAGISAETVENELNALIESQNHALKAFGTRLGVNLGTTLTAFLIIDMVYYLIHVGDCRIYEITPRQTYILTEDQTLVAREVREGRLSPEEAERDSRRNILLQCIGASKELQPQFRSAYIRENCSYLICTDGFRHMISKEEIGEGFNPEKFQDSVRLKETIRYYIDLNKSRLEEDNITAAVVVVI